VSIESTILLASGTLAVLASALVIILSPNRLAAFLAGVALFLLGLLQFGWARAIDAISWSGSNYWLDLSFVCAPTVSLAWLLFSVALGRPPGAERFRGWRVYLPIQVLLSLALVAGLNWYSPVSRLVPAGDDRVVPLTLFGDILMASLFVNLMLINANLEATYLAFSNRWRRAFGPALLAMLLCAATYGAAIAVCVLTGRFSLRGIALASIPVALVSIILPYSLLRHRVVDAAVTGTTRGVHETACFFLGALTAICLFGLNQVMHLTGWTLSRTAWVFIICAAPIGLGAIAISSRFLRILDRILDPYFNASHVDREAVWTRLSHDLDGVTTPADLFRMIPEKTAEIAGSRPVTLFTSSPGDDAFAVAGSTIVPCPVERVAFEEPLARELRATRRAIHLRRRVDDLDYIPIYVENAKQIAACEATCAIPLIQKDRLIGFLLCGNADEGKHRIGGGLLLLEIVAQMVTSRLTSLERHG